MFLNQSMYAMGFGVLPFALLWSRQDRAMGIAIHYTYIDMGGLFGDC